jgi:hypothetical protein
MKQSVFVQRSNNQVRRLTGEELALILERVRRGKQLRVAHGKPVSFQPPITSKSNCAIER